MTDQLCSWIRFGEYVIRMYRSGLFPVVQSVLVSCSNAKKTTVCSMRRNLCARFVGLRVCILTERASVRFCVHDCVCNGCARLVVNSVYPVLV